MTVLFPRGMSAGRTNPRPAGPFEKRSPRVPHGGSPRGGAPRHTAHLPTNATGPAAVIRQPAPCLSHVPHDRHPYGANKISSSSKPIVLPKEHYLILQERIKSEIDNLKHSEMSKATAVDSDEEDDDLGSDIQFLPQEQRKAFLLKAAQKRLTEEPEAVDSRNKTSSDKLDTPEIVTIDLTKDPTPPPEDPQEEEPPLKPDFQISGSCQTEHFTVSADDDYPSLDLDPRPIQWDDGLDLKTGFTPPKPPKLVTSDYPSLDCDKLIKVDRGKLRTETQAALSAIRTRLGGVLSLEAPAEAAPQEPDEDAELATLRCRSERAEVASERESRRRKRCADYPGLAFASSIFSSDTMMKFNVIKNELHNIINTQLKRVGVFFVFLSLRILTFSVCA